jgi:valyl-tRNA synthetase
MIFINKLWNASRFVSTNIELNNDLEKIESVLLKNYDILMFHEKWILSRIRHLSNLVTDAMENLDFSDA